MYDWTNDMQGFWCDPAALLNVDVFSCQEEMWLMLPDQDTPMMGHMTSTRFYLLFLAVCLGHGSLLILSSFSIGPQSLVRVLHVATCWNMMKYVRPCWNTMPNNHEPLEIHIGQLSRTPKMAILSIATALPAFARTWWCCSFAASRTFRTYLEFRVFMSFHEFATLNIWTPRFWDS